MPKKRTFCSKDALRQRMARARETPEKLAERRLKSRLHAYTMRHNDRTHDSENQQLSKVHHFEPEGPTSTSQTIYILPPPIQMEQRSVRVVELREKSRLGTTRLRCPICSKLVLGVNLANHMIRHRPNGGRLYKCELCPSSYSIINAYRAHLKSHTKAGRPLAFAKFFCEICNAVVNKDTGFIAHMNIHRRNKVIQLEDNEELYFYRCDFEGCLMNFRQKIQFDNHKDSHPSSSVSFICEICGRIFSSIANHEAHIEGAHAADSQDCPYCYKILRSEQRETHLKTHMLILGDPNGPPATCLCDACGRAFTTEEMLKRHINLAHQGDKDDEQEDLRVNKRVVGVSCRICGDVLSNTERLNKHYLNTHTYEHGTICYICDRKFATLGALKIHFHVHDSIHRLSYCNLQNCLYCTKVFSSFNMRNKHQLLAHRDQFLADKPFYCIVCFINFSTQEEMELHYDHHRKWKCPICSHHNISQMSYNSHVKAHENTSARVGRNHRRRVSRNERLLKEVGDPVEYMEHMGTNKAESSRRLKLDKKNFINLSLRYQKKVRAMDEDQDETENPDLVSSASTIEHAVVNSNVTLENPITNTLPSLLSQDEQISHLNFPQEIEVPVGLTPSSPRHKQLKDSSFDGRFIKYPEKPFKCDKCFQQYLKPISIFRHMLLAHEADPNRIAYQVNVEECARYRNFELNELWKYCNSAYDPEAPRIPIFKCGICNLEFKNVENFMEHRQESHGLFLEAEVGQPFKCAFCPRQFVYETYLRRHENLVHGNGVSMLANSEKNQESGDGGNKTQGASAASLDRKRTETPSVEGANNYRPLLNMSQQRYKCNQCPSQWHRAKSLLKHLNWHKSKSSEFSSNTDITLHPTDLLNFEMNDIHKYINPEYKSEPQMPRFKCDKCAQSFRFIKALVTHKHIVHGITFAERKSLLPFKCDLCSSGFDVEINLSRHKKLVHVRQPSSTVPNNEKSKESLSNIIPTVDKNSTTAKESLSNLTPTVEKNSTTSLEDNAKLPSLFQISREDVRTLLLPPQKAFQCDQCSGQWQHSATLQKHLEWHKIVDLGVGSKLINPTPTERLEFERNEVHKYRNPNYVPEGVFRRHKCDKCGSTFARMAMLFRHRRTCHRNELREADVSLLIKCNLCPVQFSLQSDYEEHMSSVHQRQPERPTGTEAESSESSNATPLIVKLHKRYKCSNCDQQFEDSLPLFTHLKKEHEMYVNPNESNSRFDYFEEHELKKYENAEFEPGSAPAPPNKCDKSQRESDAHLRLKHKNEGLKESDLKTKKVNNEKTTMKKRQTPINLKSSQKPTNCKSPRTMPPLILPPVANKLLRIDVSNVRQLESRIDFVYGYSCDHCSLKYTGVVNRSVIDEHLKTHSTSSRKSSTDKAVSEEFACDVCHRRFISERFLTKHKESHNSTATAQLQLIQEITISSDSSSPVEVDSESCEEESDGHSARYFQYKCHSCLRNLIGKNNSDLQEKIADHLKSCLNKTTSKFRNHRDKVEIVNRKTKNTGIRVDKVCGGNEILLRHTAENDEAFTERVNEDEDWWQEDPDDDPLAGTLADAPFRPDVTAQLSKKQPALMLVDLPIHSKDKEEATQSNSRNDEVNSEKVKEEPFDENYWADSMLMEPLLPAKEESVQHTIKCDVEQFQAYSKEGSHDDDSENELCQKMFYENSDNLLLMKRRICRSRSHIHPKLQEKANRMPFPIVRLEKLSVQQWEKVKAGKNEMAELNLRLTTMANKRITSGYLKILAEKKRKFLAAKYVDQNRLRKQDSEILREDLGKRNSIKSSNDHMKKLDATRRDILSANDGTTLRGRRVTRSQTITTQKKSGIKRNVHQTSDSLDKNIDNNKRKKNELTTKTLEQDSTGVDQPTRPKKIRNHQVTESSNSKEKTNEITKDETKNVSNVKASKNIVVATTKKTKKKKAKKNLKVKAREIVLVVQTKKIEENESKTISKVETKDTINFEEERKDDAKGPLSPQQRRISLRKKTSKEGNSKKDKVIEQKSVASVEKSEPEILEQKDLKADNTENNSSSVDSDEDSDWFEDISDLPEAEEHTPNPEKRKKSKQKKKKHLKDKEKEDDLTLYKKAMEPFSCTECDRTFRTRRKRYQHIDRYHTQRERKCSFCDLKFTNLCKLQLHRKKEHPKNTLFCEYCNKTFPPGVNLKAHIEKMHKSNPTPFECAECGQKFAVRSTYRRHGENVHGKRGKEKYIPRPDRRKIESIHINSIYPCDLCHLVMTGRKRYNRHLRIHMNIAGGVRGLENVIWTYLCDAKGCKKMYRMKDIFTSHLASHSLFPLSVCKICDKAFAESENLDKHAQNVHGDVHEKKVFDCAYCASFFEDEESFKKHEEKHKVDLSIPLPLGIHICEHCGKDFTTVASMNSHIFQFHGPDCYLDPRAKPRKSCREIKHVCQICSEPFNFQATRSFEAHLYRHTYDHGLVCFICSRKFTEYIPLENHLDKDHKYEFDPAEKRRLQALRKKQMQDKLLQKRKSFICQYCNLVLETKDVIILNRHYYSEHREEYLMNGDWMCNLCFALFNSDDSLQAHTKAVHDKHKCPLCEKQFMRGVYLRTHLLSHVGEKPHQCSFCDKSFTTIFVLRDHEKRHKKDFRVFCPLCPNNTVGFYRQVHLDQHLQNRHTEDGDLKKSKRGRKRRSDGVPKSRKRLKSTSSSASDELEYDDEQQPPELPREDVGNEVILAPLQFHPSFQFPPFLVQQQQPFVHGLPFEAVAQEHANLPVNYTTNFFSR